MYVCMYVCMCREQETGSPVQSSDGAFVNSTVRCDLRILPKLEGKKQYYNLKRKETNILSV